MRLKTIPFAALTAFTIAGSASATVLLTDNFNSSSRNGASFNDNSALTADQSGSLITVPCALGGSPYSDGASMTLNMQGNGWGGEWASPDHNFATDANSANKPLEIQFDMWFDSSNDNNSWICFSLDSTKGALLSGYNFYKRQSEGQHNYKLVISDTVGTGSGFNGIANGAKVEFFIDNASQGTTVNTLATDGGYITFHALPGYWAGYGATWGLGHVDNLTVSLVPEPSAALLGSLGMIALLRRRR